MRVADALHEGRRDEQRDAARQHRQNAVVMEEMGDDGPPKSAIRISGITIKKLKMPMYTPVRAGGSDEASTA